MDYTGRYVKRAYRTWNCCPILDYLKDKQKTPYIAKPTAKMDVAGHRIGWTRYHLT